MAVAIGLFLGVLYFVVAIAWWCITIPFRILAAILNPKPVRVRSHSRRKPRR